MKKILAVILCLVTTVSLSSCVIRYDRDESAVSESAVDPEGGLYSGAGSKQDGADPEQDGSDPADGLSSSHSGREESGQEEENFDYSDSFLPKYYHYDRQVFEKLVDALREAAEAGSADALIDAYEEAYSEILVLSDLYEAVYVLHSNDVTDEYAEEEMNYTSALVTDCTDLFSEACHDALSSSAADAFSAHLGNDLAEYFRTYEPLTDELLALYEKETALVAEYDAMFIETGDYDYEYRGRKWTVDDLSGSEAGRLAQSDPAGYIEVYKGLTKKINESLGPIFLELLQLRKQIAEQCGYDNYSEYAYREIFMRGYTPDDAEEFCAVVRESIAPDYNETVYSSDVLSDAPEFDPGVSSMLGDIEYFADRISPVSQKAYRVLTEEKLYDLGYGGNRIDSNFTGQFHGIAKSYIFCNFDHSLYDFASLTHEFGHFSYFCTAGQSNVFTRLDDYDVLEIHSNGFELLCTELYEDLFGADAADMQRYVIAQQLASVIDGCREDEFQRRIYENPDMTLDEINRLYAEITENYGGITFGDEAYEWCMIPHHFSSPLYYLSYAVSAVSSLEIWEDAREDFAAGTEEWENVVNAAGQNLGYFDVIDRCGLTPITDSEGVKNICGGAIRIFLQ